MLSCVRTKCIHAHSCREEASSVEEKVEELASLCIRYVCENLASGHCTDFSEVPSDNPRAAVSTPQQIGR